MDNITVPSLSSGVVGSRFVSQGEIDSAKAKREEQWKAAYARLGQEPPPQPVEDSSDGRSLAEKLAANRTAKQEEWEEKTRLANQFRALEEDEIMFLDSLREREQEEERQRKQKDGEEVKNFKDAVAARHAADNPPAQTVRSLANPPVKPAGAASRKDAKKPLKGVVVKKKPKTTAIPARSACTSGPNQTAQNGIGSQGGDKSDTDALPQAKRRKVSDA